MSRLNGFLEGVKVLDLSLYIPGPMATLFLSDLGASVLKIEPPQGDEMARLGPRDCDGGPVFYRALNAGKSVRRLDLKSDDDRRAFLALVETHDVLVEGFRPDVTRQARRRLCDAFPDQPAPGLLLDERIWRDRGIDGPRGA